MSDRPRHVPNTAPRDHAEAAEGADRESRVEQLLLAGLDQYFAGRYEQAIDVWTRVAFLDRRNNRAKAYIDRARGLVAERQRELEALVQEGVAAYNAGDLASSRTLLMRAVDRGGHSDTAQLFLERLQRSEAIPTQSAPSRQPARQDGHRPRVVWNWVSTVAVSAVLAAVILVGARPVATFVADLPIAVPAAAPVPVDPLPIARSSDRVLAQARTLRDQGRIADAIRLLESVDRADVQRAAADALRAEIQRTVLADGQELDVTAEATR